MNSFFLWLVVLTKEYEQQITHALINSGYSVTALSIDGKVLAPAKNASAMLAYSLVKTGDNVSYQTVYNDVSMMMSKLAIRCFACVLTHQTLGTWSGANFDLSNVDEIVSPPSKDMLN